MFVVLIVFLVSLSFVSADDLPWDFYGYVKDVDGNALNNSVINVTLWTMGGGAPSCMGSNSTTSYNHSTNGVGWFNVSITANSSWLYKPVITHRNSTTNAVDFVGQALPTFPFGEFNDTFDINFYLRDAGTLNLTAVNRTGDRVQFWYQVKDAKLSYTIEEEWDNMVDEAIIYVPRDRNYSVMIFANESMPVSFSWNNFSAESDYDIDDLSTYNVTIHTVHKQFNLSDGGVRVSGYINTSGISGWDEFKIVPYLLETENMVYLGDDAGVPLNMSFGSDYPSSDEYNLATGWYNITLPAAVETSNFILFATARNGTTYYGGYRNLTLNFTSPDEDGFNFTMYGLLGDAANITRDDFASGVKSVNISTAKQSFNLINTTENVTLESVSAYFEISVDYSDYDCKEITFMINLDNSDGILSIPLLNVTGIKEMNVYSTDYAPRRIDKMSVSEIRSNNNITMASFNPGDIDGALEDSQIFVKFYYSNSTCDVPNPDDACQIGAFGPDESQTRDSFSPLSVIIGGGKLSFRMGYGNINIHYVDVDLLASGPPDMMFENDAGSSESSTSFENAIKFGSAGPSIYDYVLISFPYTEGSTTTTGLNEENDVNMSIPTLYDEDWNTIWSTTSNGTSGDALAGNYSHYSARSSEWETLIQSKNCTKNVSDFNVTNPCYVDTTNNMIWVRLPHFSGVDPTITGYLLTATSNDDDDTSSSGGGGGGTLSGYWNATYVASDEQFGLGYTRELAVATRIKVEINKTFHYVGVVDISSGGEVTINVSSDNPQQVVLDPGESAKFDVDNDGYNDILVTLNKVLSSKVEVSIKAIHVAMTEEEKQAKEGTVGGEEVEEEEEEGSKLWIWITLGVLAVVVAGLGIYYYLYVMKKRIWGYKI